MDPQQIPSFELPKSHEQKPGFSQKVDIDPQISLEGTREILPAPLSTVTQQPVPVIAPNPTVTTPASQPIAQTVPSNDDHIIAEDNDVIEKEWVERAKKIVSLTSQDPYVEVKELSKLKATYMRKRFNRDVPVSGEKTA